MIISPGHFIELKMARVFLRRMLMLPIAESTFGAPSARYFFRGEGYAGLFL
jgi:hypothetical protein